MNENNELTQQIKELNRQLKELKNSGRYMLYAANPFKFAFFNFLSGIFHSLGTLFGYLVVAAAIFYLFSQLNLNSLISRWLENTLGQINWEKIVPVPDMRNLPLGNFPDQTQDIDN